MKTRHSRVQNRMSTWLNMADCVRRMARWKSFCRECSRQNPQTPRFITGLVTFPSQGTVQATLPCAVHPDLSLVSG